MAKESRGLVLFGLGALALCTMALAVPSEAAVGRTAGSFNVTNSGAATYSIPIFTPPGPHGVQPSIALVYNSNANVGYLGRGWSLAGLSSITRCAKTLAEDGSRSAVAFSPYDGYCLDGNRLRLQSGGYGTSGSVYATEVADFSRITANGSFGYVSPASWTVERKDGLTYTYGAAGNSQAIVPYPAVGAITEWALNEISDRAGNKVKFTWVNVVMGAPHGNLHPSKIEWTQTSAGSGSYVYSMDFSYGTNELASIKAGYVGGRKFDDPVLLTGIKISVSSTVKRNYVLTYDISPSTGAKRLTQVMECSDDGATDCLSPTNISYQDGASGVDTGSPFVITGNITAADGKRDFNGDGIKDIAYQLSGTWYVRLGSISSGYGSPISTGLSSFLPGKLLGDASDQLLSSSGGTWYVYALSGSSFVATTTGISTTALPSDPIVADVDGDGRDDLVVVGAGPPFPFFPGVNFPSMVSTVWRNTSAGGSASFGSAVNSSFGMYDSPGYAAALSYPTPPFNAHIFGLSASKGDVDGDGRQDIALSLTILWCDGAMGCGGFDEGRVITFDASLQMHNTIVTNPSGLTVMITGLGDDLNHDGCDDFVVPAGVAMSDCAGGVSADGVFTYFYEGSMDWNGDGSRDYLGLDLYSGNLLVYPTYGAGLGSPISTGIACNIVRTDGDGDGLDDLGCLSSGSSLTIYHHNAPNVVPDLATSFTDGFGVTYSPSYTAIARDNYSPHSGTAYPYRDVVGDRRVVGTAAASDGIGGTYNTTYNYVGAVTNLEGRGFSGFDEIDSVDARNSFVHVQKFEHTFPNTGMVIEDSLYQPGGIHKISSKTVTPAVLAAATLDATPGNERFFPHPDSTTEDAYEVGGALDTIQITHTAQSYTFDSWGNVTASTKTVTDTDATSPLNTYSWVTATSTSITPDTTHWCLGLPDSSSVTYSTTTGEATVTQSKSFTPDTTYCRMSADSVEPLSSTLKVDTSYGYDGFGNVDSVSVTGRDGGTAMTARTTATNWGTTGQFPVSETNALSQTTTRTFDPTFGGVLTETDPNGIVVASNAYDSFGRVSRATRADGTSTAYTYALCVTYGCSNGDAATGSGLDKTIVIAQELDASSALTRDTWTHRDILDREIVVNHRLLSGGYDRIGSVYDAMGRVSKKTAPCDNSSCTPYWITNTYDLLGRLSIQSRPRSDSDATAVTSTFAYAGRTQTVTDPNSKVSTKILDVNGWMRRSTDHDGYYQSFGYDGAGSLAAVTDSLSNSLFSASYYYGIKPFQYSTTDMDLGHWTYDYNSLGELVSWHDPNTHDFNQTYDPLSRTTTREDVHEGITTTWTWGTTAGSHNIGQVSGISMTGSAYGEALSYDSVGRLSQRIVTTDQNYYINYDYTNQGLLDTLTYPESTSSIRVKVKYGYAYGIPQSVTDWTGGSAGTVYWTANTQNIRGQTTQETLGNGVVTNRDFDAVTGWLNSIQSGHGGGTGLQNQSYAYDDVGNVTQRQENTLGLTENLGYDNLYRLTSSQVNSNTPVTYAYDAMGNITHRSDVNGNATWTYDGTKKHAVATTGSGGASYGYDANGNMNSRDGQAIHWTSYNYPDSLATATESTAFYYGPDRQYYRQDYTGPSVTETTYYVGGLLEKVCASTACSSGTTDWRHYITVNGQAVAIVSRKSGGGTDAVNYPLEDNQGSGSNLTDSSGTSLARESYSAFGLPRDGSDWDGAVPSGDQIAINAVSRRGYTGQSMLGNMGLIHMNGRVQDAITGRFLSPDPNIPHPDFTQSYNRYSYVRNNPLTYGDPSGFAEKGFTSEQCAHDGIEQNGCWQLFASFTDICRELTGFCISDVADLISQGWTLGDIASAQFQGVGERMFLSTTTAAQANYQAARQAGNISVGAPESKTGASSASSPQSPSLAELNQHWKDGSGKPIYIDASRLMVRLEGDEPAVGGRVSGMVTGEDFFKYGRVDLNRVGEERYEIASENYDFDRKLPYMDNLSRNLSNEAGRWHAGPGVPFETIFVGSPQVTPYIDFVSLPVR